MLVGTVSWRSPGSRGGPGGGSEFHLIFSSGGSGRPWQCGAVAVFVAPLWAATLDADAARRKVTDGTGGGGGGCARAEQSRAEPGSLPFFFGLPLASYCSGGSSARTAPHACGIESMCGLM